MPMHAAQAMSTYFQPRTPSRPRDDALSRFITMRGRKRRRDGNGGLATAEQRASCDVIIHEQQPPRHRLEQPKGQLTLMEQQVVAVKEKHPGTLLLFECGYRMRMFGDDAQNAAQVLGIQAQRHRRRQFVEASVPVPRLLFHARRLVKAGFRVGVARQMTTTAMRASDSQPATDPKVPLEREVQEIFTRATIPEELSEDGSQETRFILAVVEQVPSVQPLFAQFVHEMKQTSKNYAVEHVQTGIYAYDMHTGESFADEFEDDGQRQAMSRVLSLIEPVEFVLPAGGLSAPTMQAIESYIASREYVQDHQRQLASKEHTFAKVHSLNSWTATMGPTALRVEVLPNQEFSTSHTDSEPNCGDRDSSDRAHVLPQLALVSFQGLCTYLRSLNWADACPSLRSARVQAVVNSTTPLFRWSRGAEQDLGIFVTSPNRTTGGSLFELINHTRTPFGARRLKAWLRQPLLDLKDIKHRQDAVAWLANPSPALSGGEMYEDLTESVLSNVVSMERQLQRIHLRSAYPREVLRLLENIVSINSELSRVRTKTEKSRDVVSRDVPPAVYSLLRDFPDLQRDASSCIDMLDVEGARQNSLERILSKEWSCHPDVHREYSDIHTELADIQQQHELVLMSNRRTLQDDSIEYCTHRLGFGKCILHLIEVDRSALETVPDDWLLVNSNRNVVRFYSPDTVTLHLREEILNERKQQLIRLVWRDLLATLEGLLYVKGMQCVDRLATLDALCSLATTARLHPDYTLPKCVAPNVNSATGQHGQVLSIVRGRHPMLDHAITRDSYISNSISMTGTIAEGFALNVSGPNMGGKSTLLRMTALIVIMTQVGSLVPCQSATLSVFDGVATRMLRPAVANSMQNAPSAGYSEMHALGEIASQTSRRSLVLLDEIGFGMTSAQSRATAIGVVRYLVKAVGCHVMLATHMTDVIHRLETVLGDQACQSISMGYTITPWAEPADQQDEGVKSTVVFRYDTNSEERAGSFAFQAAQVAGIPVDVVKTAMSLYEREGVA